MIEVRDRTPVVDVSAWVAPGAVLAGSVTVGAGASVWYGAIVRGDLASVTIGVGTNIQDGCVLHADPASPLTIGSNVTVGHRAVLHGCAIADDVLVGMGSVVMNDARIGAGSIIAAGTLVLEGAVVPPGSLVVGSPGAVRRGVTALEREHIARSAGEYARLAADHAAATSSS